MIDAVDLLRVVFEFANTGGEPDSLSDRLPAADQQHWVRARVRNWTVAGEEGVDAEIPVGRERYAGFIKNAGRGGGTAEERGVNARASGGSDVIAICKKQAAPLDLDVSVGLDRSVQI